MKLMTLLISVLVSTGAFANQDLVEACKKEYVNPNLPEVLKSTCLNSCEAAEDYFQSAQSIKDYYPNIVLAQVPFSRGIRSVGSETSIEINLSCTSGDVFVTYEVLTALHDDGKQNVLKSRLSGPENLSLNLSEKDDEKVLTVKIKDLTMLNDFGLKVQEDNGGEDADAALEELAKVTDINEMNLDGRLIADTTMSLELVLMNEPNYEYGKYFSRSVLKIEKPVQTEARDQNDFGVNVLVDDDITRSKNMIAMIKTAVALNKTTKNSNTAEVINEQWVLKDKKYVHTILDRKNLK